MITDNSPALGTFSIKDAVSDSLHLERGPAGDPADSILVEADAPVLIRGEEITPLIQFLAHGLTTEQKTQLAMSLLDSVSFKDVLDHFGLESQR